jgi:hypothetical protein
LDTRVKEEMLRLIAKYPDGLDGFADNLEATNIVDGPEKMVEAGLPVASVAIGS